MAGMVWCRFWAKVRDEGVFTAFCSFESKDGRFLKIKSLFACSSPNFVPSPSPSLLFPPRPPPLPSFHPNQLRPSHPLSLPPIPPRPTPLPSFQPTHLALLPPPPSATMTRFPILLLLLSLLIALTNVSSKKIKDNVVFKKGMRPPPKQGGRPTGPNLYSDNFKDVLANDPIALKPGAFVNQKQGAKALEGSNREVVDKDNFQTFDTDGYTDIITGWNKRAKPLVASAGGAVSTSGVPDLSYNMRNR